MARTKASVVGKVFSGKSSAKVSKSQPKTSSKASSSGSSYGTGGNPYFPRETPGWQKPITNFFCGPISNADKDGEVPSSSKADAVKRKRKTMAISSDTESDNEEIAVDKPVSSNDTDVNSNSNTFLNESCDMLDDSDAHLLPLTDDESCHKIGEYFNVNERTKNTSSGEKKTNDQHHNDSNTEVLEREGENETKNDPEDVIKIKLGMFKNKGKGKGKGKKSSNSIDGNLSIENVDKDDNANSKNTEKENLKPSNANKIKPMDSHKIDLGKKHELDEGISENIPKKVRIDV